MNKYILLILFIFQQTAESQEYMKVRIFMDSPGDLKKIIQHSIDFSDAQYKYPTLDVTLNRFEYDSLINPFYKNEILIPDLELYYAAILKKSTFKTELQSGEYFREGSISGYFKLDEIYSEFDRMMEKYPLFISKIQYGKSVEDRPLFSYCIGNGACASDNDYPQVLITALHHSREPGSIFTVLYYFWDLFKRYDNDEKTAQYILRNHHIFILPVINPDGVAYNDSLHPDGGGLWRKNRRYNGDSSFGVDLNRNYGPLVSWDSPNEGSSTIGKMDTYRGSSIFSEPEIDAVRKFMVLKNIKIGVNCHTFGNSVYFPYSYLTKECPDSIFFHEFLSENYRNNRYLSGLDADVLNYTTRGSADDFFYLGNNTFKGFLSMTLEIGNGEYGFWSPIDKMYNYAQQNIPFFDNLILSSNKNIALSDKDILSINNKYFLKLKLSNIGYENTGDFTFNIISADSKVSIDNSFQSVSSLKRGESQEFLVEYHPVEIENGDMAKFEITANLDFEKKIQFELPVFEFSEYNIFDEQFLNNWELEDDWTFSENNNHEKILKSNSDSTYKPGINSYAKFKINIDNDSVSRYTLRFEHNYEIEPNYDFGLLSTKFNGSEFKNVKTGEYLAPGSNRSDGTQSDSLYGFHGIAKNRFSQNIYLNEMNEQVDEFSFNLRSDKNNNKSGWKISDLKLRIFPKKKVSSVLEENKTSLKIYPNPNSNHTIYIESTENLTESKIDIYDLKGKLIFTCCIEINTGINLFQIPELFIGRYNLVINSQSKTEILPLIIGN